MSKEGAYSCQKGAFTGGRGVVCALNGAIMSGKGVFLCQKSAFAGSGESGTIYLCLEWSRHGRERALFVPERRLRWRRGQRICLKGRSNV